MILDFDRCAKEIDEARHRAEALMLGLTTEQLITQPEAGKWSIAECILHLNVTASQIDPLKLVPDFLKAQDEWERLIRESAGLDLAKIKVGKRFSPFRARFAAALPWMMAHQRRHLLQAENVKRQIFSAAPKAATQAG